MNTTIGIAAARRAIGGDEGKDIDIARLLGVTAAAVSRWKGVVPPDRAIEIEQKTGGKVTRYEIRPDYFGAGAAVASEATTEAASAVPGEVA